MSSGTGRGRGIQRRVRDVVGSLWGPVQFEDPRGRVLEQQVGLAHGHLCTGARVTQQASPDTDG